MAYKQDWARREWSRRMRERLEDLPGVTCATIAADLGVDLSTVWRWMNGKVLPPDEMRWRLAYEILRCPPERVFPFPKLEDVA